jgi:hypothetical protein
LLTLKLFICTGSTPIVFISLREEGNSELGDGATVGTGNGCGGFKIVEVVWPEMTFTGSILFVGFRNLC